MLCLLFSCIGSLFVSGYIQFFSDNFKDDEYFSCALSIYYSPAYIAASCLYICFNDDDDDDDDDDDNDCKDIDFDYDDDSNK